jgi:hypothetical protein
LGTEFRSAERVWTCGYANFPRDFGGAARI